MSDRAEDWLAQANRDLEQAMASRAEERHEWACFAAQQSAEKAVKALHLAMGQEAWGHVVARLLAELPFAVDQNLVEKGKVLDNFYVPTRYANGHPEALRSNTTARSKAARRSTMPVRSLSSSVLKWPSRADVAKVLPAWASAAAAQHPELASLGCFGSFARDDWAVGSDLDLVAVVDSSGQPFERRAAGWNLNELPVPADLLVYTRAEWDRMERQGGRFAATLAREAIWIYRRPEET